MTTRITFRIKTSLKKEKLQQDAHLLLKRFANWAPILAYPNGMDLIAIHNYGTNKLLFFFSTFTPKFIKGTEIKLGHMNCYVLEIAQLLRRMKLYNTYEVIETFVGESEIKVPYNQLDNLNKNGYIDYKSSFMVKVHSSKLRINPYTAKCPGVRIRLLLNKKIHISQECMLEDIKKLLFSLNHPKKKNLIIKTDNEPFIGFPAVFLGFKQCSVDIGILASGILGYKPYYKQIIKGFDKYLKFMNLAKRYFVSMLIISPDISNDIFVTQNQSLLEKSNFKHNKVPQQYLCALTNQLMDKAVIIPDFDGRIDMFAITRIITTSGKNPYTNKKLTYKDIKVDIKLTKKISAFVTQLVKKYQPKKLQKNKLQHQLFFRPNISDDEKIKIAHDELLLKCSIFRSKKNMPFFKSLSQKNYTQALRRACTSTSSDAFELLKILLNFKDRLKFNINETNKNKRSALHIAALKKNEQAYHYLLQVGASDNIKDNQGKKPSDYAKINNFTISKFNCK